jgi:uncharacterized protein YoxC
MIDDVEPLREIANAQFEFAHLFTPARAWRVHPDNNNDTPLPPETPAGETPPTGAVIDYWLEAGTHGPVTLDIFDANGRMVRHFSSVEVPQDPPAERYFAKAWTKPPQALAATPGMHRFVWNLRYERPDAAEYSYSIAAVWGRATPIEPQGAWVLPGQYTVALTVSGGRYITSLTVAEDPRVKVSLADLQASLALSRKIAPPLADAALGYREQRALTKLLEKRYPKTAKLQDETRKLLEPLQAKPAEGNATFESVADMLSGVERALESADAAPTPAQQQFVKDAITKLETLKREWEQVKSGSLASLNAALARAGQKSVLIPDKDKLAAEEPDEGEDLP